MKKTIIFLALLGLSFLTINGQTTTQTPKTGGSSSDEQKTSGVSVSAPQPNRQSSSGDFSLTVSRDILRLRFLKMASKFYRKPNKEELKVLAPQEEDLRKHAEFLQAENTGLIRLMPDLGCAENEKVLVANEACLKYSMPGGGSGFSFRKGGHWTWRLADIVFKGENFYSISKYQQGIFINLGDIDLEKVSLQTKAVDFLMTYSPPENPKEAQKNASLLKKGVAVGKNKYSSIVSAKVNNTYVLRSIAYRGKLLRSYIGYVYNELELDERKDIVVVFRVIRKDTDGSLTLLWKELSRKKSPKLDFKAPIEKFEVKPQSFVAQEKKQ